MQIVISYKPTISTRGANEIDAWVASLLRTFMEARLHLTEQPNALAPRGAVPGNPERTWEIISLCSFRFELRSWLQPPKLLSHRRHGWRHLTERIRVSGNYRNSESYDICVCSCGAALPQGGGNDLRDLPVGHVGQTGEHFPELSIRIDPAAEGVFDDRVEEGAAHAGISSIRNVHDPLQRFLPRCFSFRPSRLGSSSNLGTSCSTHLPFSSFGRFSSFSIHLSPSSFLSRCDPGSPRSTHAPFACLSSFFV